MRRACILLLMIFSASTVHAAEFHDVALKEPYCETFTLGESGHSDRCAGPAGYKLIIHHRRSRIDLEIAPPSSNRGVKVHRLIDYLGDVQRFFSKATARWLVQDKKAVALALSFDVEPQPYEQHIPLTLVFRVDDGFKDCVIATIGEGSKRKLDDVMQKHGDLKCRSAFPKDT